MLFILQVSILSEQTGMTGLGEWRRASQWKGESKGVIVNLTRERASEVWKTISCFCVCVTGNFGVRKV